MKKDLLINYMIRAVAVACVLALFVMFAYCMTVATAKAVTIDGKFIFAYAGSALFIVINAYIITIFADTKQGF